MMEDSEIKKKLKYARILHVLMILAVIFYCFIIYIFVPNLEMAIFEQSDPELQYIG